MESLLKRSIKALAPQLKDNPSALGISTEIGEVAEHWDDIIDEYVKSRQHDLRVIWRGEYLMHGTAETQICLIVPLADAKLIMNKVRESDRLMKPEIYREFVKKGLQDGEHENVDEYVEKLKFYNIDRSYIVRVIMKLESRFDPEWTMDLDIETELPTNLAEVEDGDDLDVREIDPDGLVEAYNRKADLLRPLDYREEMVADGSIIAHSVVFSTKYIYSLMLNVLNTVTQLGYDGHGVRALLRSLFQEDRDVFLTVGGEGDMFYDTSGFVA